MSIPIPVVVLVVAFVLIAVRHVGRIRLEIWEAMLLGAVAVLVTGQITPVEALKAIDLDTMVFLFSMFIIGVALEESGYLSYISHRIFRRIRSSSQLPLYIMLIMGLSAALLMNDTIAIIGTPIVLTLAKKYGVNPKSLLITLAFAVTIGSVMSPIGNPQNFIIATQGPIENPFYMFFKYLAIPTIINLLITCLIIKLYYMGEFSKVKIPQGSWEQEHIRDPELATLSKVSLTLLVALIMIKTATSILNIPIGLTLMHITLIAALPILIISRKRATIIRKVDWKTLIFFASMFILMKSVWNTGFFQTIITSMNMNILSISAILGVSVLLSQLMSNVPMVMLYLPMLNESGASMRELIALAAGSTIAGNLTILGAASNVIIIQNAEKHGKTLTFFEFVKIGAPTTIVNTLIYLLPFLMLM